MVRTASQDRVAFLAPLVRRAFAALAQVIAGMDALEVQASLQRMSSDPAEVLIWENAGSRAWEAYDAGGPLGAERIELAVAPGLSLGLQPLLAMLDTLAASDVVRLLATPEPWRILVRAPGLPRVTVETCPTLDAPEDLMLRVVIGSNDAAGRLFKPGWLEDLWRRRTAQAFQGWLAVNRARPLVEHPAFAEVVEAPAMGLPGVHLVRSPPLPYSPLLPASAYQQPVAWAVVETAEELAGCRAYYRTPGASFFTEPPLFRNRPPCSMQPARLAGGTAPSTILAVRTPWEGNGVVSVCTLPDAVLQRRPQLRQQAYRGRYLVLASDDVAQALATWREAGIEVHEVELPRSVH